MRRAAAAARWLNLLNDLRAHSFSSAARPHNTNLSLSENSDCLLLFVASIRGNPAAVAEAQPGGTVTVEAMYEYAAGSLLVRRGFIARTGFARPAAPAKLFPTVPSKCQATGVIRQSGVAPASRWRVIQNQ